MKDGSLLAQTKGLLRRHNIRARKGLGQHFLVDAEVLQQVVSAADLSQDDTVVEVGPGLGILTAELARRAGRVIAVELDDRLAAMLKQSLADCPNVTVINQDILKLDPATLPVGQRFKVVANLPYYITSPVLRHFLEAAAKPQMMVLMVQQEVAQAITAGPGQRSVLSISVQFYGKPSIVSRVPAQSFYPAPEVDSAILKIAVYPRPTVPVTDEKGFFALVRAGFAAARKQLPNSLAQGTKLPKAEVLPLLEKAGIAPQRRAETLTLEEWSQLYQAFQAREGR